MLIFSVYADAPWRLGENDARKWANLCVDFQKGHSAFGKSTWCFWENDVSNVVIQCVVKGKTTRRMSVFDAWQYKFDALARYFNRKRECFATDILIAFLL